MDGKRLPVEQEIDQNWQKCWEKESKNDKISNNTYIEVVF